MEEMLLQKEYLFITMPEEVDHHTALRINRQADQYILGGQVRHVVFDFKKTTFCDSAGIGILVGRHKKVSCIGGKVYVTGISPRIKKMLYMSGMMNLVELYTPYMDR